MSKGSRNGAATGGTEAGRMGQRASRLGSRALRALLALALLLAPAVVAWSHGPTAALEAELALAEAMSHGHAHAIDDNGPARHDATDHEHQTLGVLPGTSPARAARARGSAASSPLVRPGRAREGPRRPPRRA